MAKRIPAKKRDSAAIARLSRIAKARKVLKEWSDGNVRLELLVPEVGLRVRGAIRQLGDDPKDTGFLFLSASREVSSMIFLEIWKEVSVERTATRGVTVHLRSELSHRHDLTLVEEGNRGSKASEMSALLEQLRLWTRLQTKLISSFEFPFASSYWAGEIEEYTPGIFALTNKDSGQLHMVDTARSGRVEIERIDARTIVTLTSRTGHFQVTISDVQGTVKEASERFAMKSKMVH